MFTNKLSEIMENRGVTAYKVAKSTGISQGLMNQYKNGINIPTIQNLIKIADYLNCSVDYLLDRTDKPDITYKTSSGTKIIIEAMTPPNVEALQRVYSQLDETGQDKVIAYAEDLIQSGKYKKNTAVHLIAARGDGGIKELSEEEYKKLEKAIQDLPDANDLDYL